MDEITHEAIAAARERIADAVWRTPVWHWRSEAIAAAVPDANVFLKLEALQTTGSFKVRGALLWARSLDLDTRARGLVAVSAGNHAIAVAWAAAVVGTTAIVVMPRTADPARVRRCAELGGEVRLVDDVHTAFAEVEAIVAREGRTFVHPFEGVFPALGSATLGLEIAEDVPAVDAVIVPVGGGGLCAGVATAIKLLRPQCEVWAVEPEGADSMHRSFGAGRPMSIESVQTIADSLGAPHAAPYSFALCHKHVDALVKVSDDELRRAMAVLFREAKLAVEPAGAASTAALLGPLRERAAGRTVVPIVCGANVDVDVFHRHVRAGLDLLAAAPLGRDIADEQRLR
jgi:threonine dehydratase